MRFAILPAALAVALSIAPAAPRAHAQMRCGPVQAVQQALADKHGETTAFHGLTAAGRSFMLFADPEDGSWTAVMIDGARALACLIAAGEDGALIDQAPAQKGEAS